MDYKGNGNNFQNSTNEAFFTAGNGNSAPEINDSGASINAGIFSDDRDPRTIGQSAMSNTEVQLAPSEAQNYEKTTDTTVEPQEFGQLVPISPSDFAPQDTTNVSSAKTISQSSSPESSAKQAVSEFKSTGQISTLYDQIRGEGGLVDASLKEINFSMGEQ